MITSDSAKCSDLGRRSSAEGYEEALALYLETFDELGKSIPEELGQKQPVSLGVTVRIPVIV